MSTYHVNLYMVNQAYGGPEEGGWWYEVGIFIQSASRLLYASGEIAVAQALRDRLQEAVDEIQDAGPGAYRAQLSSVNCTGRKMWLVEEHQGESYPEFRPVYE